MQNGVKILLIESDPACRAMVSSMIRMNFPETDVDVTGDTNEAIAWLDNRAYDVVLCDAHLVGGGKLQFVRRMCRTNYPSAVVVATGDTDITLDYLRTVTPPLCVRDVIYKPIVVMDALSKIGRIIEDKKTGAE